MRRALLVRHCETDGQWPDAALTARGREQADALAAFLAAHPIDRIVSSPYARARASIEPFARRTGLAIAIDDGLAERRLSREPIAHWREVVERSFSEPDLRVDGGESAAETRARGWAALQGVLARGDRLPVVVSHGQLLSLVLHAIDPSFGFAGWAAMSNPDVFLLEARPGGGFAFRRLWR